MHQSSRGRRKRPRSPQACVEMDRRALPTPRLDANDDEDEDDDMAILMKAASYEDEGPSAPVRELETKLKIVKAQLAATPPTEYETASEEDDEDTYSYRGNDPVEYDDIFSACEVGDLHAVKYLIDRDEDVLCVRDEQGRTPLCLSIELGWLRLSMLLLSRGSPLDDIDAKGYSALHHTVRQHGSLPKLLPHVLLHQRGVSVNGPGHDGTTPLQLVSNVKVLRLLLSHGADPSGDALPDSKLEKWGGKEAKRARALLQRAAFQSYSMYKLRYIRRDYAHERCENAPVLAKRTKGIRAVTLEDDGVPDPSIICKEEVAGSVFSYVSKDHLYLVRLDSTSPRSSPMAPRGPQSLQSLMEQDAEAFDVGLVDEGVVRVRSPSIHSVHEDDVCDEDEDDDDEWMLVPPFPRVELHRDVASLACDVMEACVSLMKDDMFDWLNEMLWSSGGRGSRSSKSLG